ncbi:activating transcription factor 7-interacting protein 1-like isoform X1 [Mizuhopecten yessoensis]|nr:activating transcription factor 7-interacting protein 1-like isoform X1 [Mizuhopecten yessoensis]
MSATENEVCSLTMPYPSTVGKSTNCVTSTMPVSEEMDSSTPSSTSGHPKDCNGGTNGVSKDISLNFTQTLLSLKALNGQTKFGTEDKKVTSKEEDIVILDHSPSSDANPKAAVSGTSSSPSLLPASLLPKPPISMTEGVRPATNSVYEHPKANKFEINERVRSSFKDIMSKIQENTPSLQNLLAKTKDLDTRERKEERERLEREQQAAKAISTMGKGSGDNVFENLKGLNCDTDLREKPITKSVDIVACSTAPSIKPPISSISNSKDQDVILLDDPELEEDIKSKPVVEASETPSEEQKDEIKTDLAEETKAVQDCDNSSNVQLTIRDSSRSPICIDSDNSFENEAPIKSDSSSTIKAEEELLKIDQDEVTNDKKVEETDTKEEEERLLASDSDDDKTKESKLNNEDKNGDGKQGESAESLNMEVENKEEDILVLEANGEKTEQEGKDCDESDVKVGDSDKEADVKGNNEINEEKDESKDESKEKEDSIGVKEEDVKKEVKEIEVKMEVDEDDASQSSSSSSDSSASSKSSQEDVKSQVKTEVKSEDSGSSTPESADRKRPADSSDLSAQPKRSRLDMVIGKLGSAIGIQPDTLKDEPDEMSDIEESHESEVTESVKSEDTTSTVTEDEDDSQDSPKKKPGVKKHRIRLTESELEQIVRTKVKMYMKVEREKKYKEMQDKVEELTQTIDFWKSNYRELERQVLNVTILQQKHEKRKAKTVALRELSTKNVGVQVDENKTNQMNHLSQQTTPTKGSQAMSKTQTKTNAVGAFQPILVKNSTAGVTMPILAPPNTSVLLSTNTVPPKLTPMTVTKMSQSLATPGSPCLIQSLATTPGMVNNALPKTVMQSPMDRSVKNLLENKRMVMPATKLMGANPPVSGLIPVLVTTSQPNMARPPLLAKPSNTLTISTPGQSRPGDVVDLTGEEDTGMKRYTTPAASTNLVTGVPQGIPVTTVQPGGLLPQQILRPTIPSQAHGVASNSGILLSTPAGTQIMRNPQQTFQLVFNSSSPAIRPGSLLTVMQGPGGNNQIIRPIMTTTSGQPPQLRAAAAIQPPVQRANLSKTVAPSNVKIMTRPPPPLQVAPPPPLQVAQPINSAPPPKAPEPHHPAPLPVASSDQVKPGQKPLPPKPTLKISRVSQGIVLSWNMTLNQTPHADVASYQLFAYQEGSTHPTTALWKKVGDVKALPLPMACTLTQFQEGNRYHFAVRAVDVHTRVGPFSEPNTIHLLSKKD